MARPRTSPQPEVPGLAARRIAADIIDGVLRRRIALDEQLSGKAAHPSLPALADRDRALMRRLVATILRRLGTLGHLLSQLLDRGVVGHLEPQDLRRADQQDGFDSRRIGRKSLLQKTAKHVAQRAQPA